MNVQNADTACVVETTCVVRLTLLVLQASSPWGRSLHMVGLALDLFEANEVLKGRRPLTNVDGFFVRTLLRIEKHTSAYDMLVSWFQDSMHNDVCDTPVTSDGFVALFPVLSTSQYHLRHLLRVYWRRILEPECARAHPWLNSETGPGVMELIMQGHV